MRKHLKAAAVAAATKPRRGVSELALQAFNKGKRSERWLERRNGSLLERAEVLQWRKRRERRASCWKGTVVPRLERKKRGKGQEKGGKGDNRVCWNSGKAGQVASNCIKWSCSMSLSAVEEDKGDINDKVHEDEGGS